MTSYLEEEQVRAKVQRGLRSVERVLAQNRTVGLGSDVGHSYGDKYALAEFMVRGACGGALNSLQQLGLGREGLRELKERSKEKHVTLSLWREEKCTFDKKTKREVEGSRGTETDVGGLLKITTKTVTTVEEYFWDVEGRWELRAFDGTDRTKKVVLRERKGATKVKTLSEGSPRPSQSVQEGLDMDVSWLLTQVNGDLEVEFDINRNAEDCHTPRRNAEVEGALAFFNKLSQWCTSVRSYFKDTVFPVEQDHGLDLTFLQNPEDIFVPVLPVLQMAGDALLEERKEKNEKKPALVAHQKTAVADDLTGKVLGRCDLEAFLEEEVRSLQESVDRVQKSLESGKGFLTGIEGTLVTVLQHLMEVAEWTRTGLDFVEGMLMRQLVAALGRVVTSEDFGRYMRFHNRKLFREEVAPREFCYAVRRDGHDPEGVVAVEGSGEDGMALPVMTTVRRLPPSSEKEGGDRMRFALNAAAEVSFGGERFVHAYVRHRFSTEAGGPLELVARARQFSGFVLAIGRIGGRDLFLPEHAVLVRNKDELRVPLELEQIPTPKEFEDAIESLSPEQQRFAKAYRSMQMEATLFGVCVMQIKPQLERVLNLPQGALTKEIRLTEDLLELFIDYHISSDLLSFQADPLDKDGVPTTNKVEAVRGRVEAMQAVIQEAKDEILEEEKRVAEMKRLKMEEKKRVAERRLERRDELQRKRYQLSEMKEKRSRGSFLGRVMESFGANSRNNKKCMDGDFMDDCMDSLSYAEDNLIMEKNDFGGATEDDLLARLNELCEDGRVAPVQDGGDDLHDAEGGEEVEGKEEIKQNKQNIEEENSGYDISKLPEKLEGRYKEFDEDNCLRPTIIKTGPHWWRKVQKTLLSPAEEEALDGEGQKKERNKAFDLLDALTRSGALPVEDASLHVVVAATHCFDLTLMDTVVQRSVNPVEKVERSTLIAASVVHDAHPSSLIKDNHLHRLATCSPKLMAQ